MRANSTDNANPVGAMLAPGGVPTKDVTDDACSLEERAALWFFVGTPPGASSLLQGFAF